MRSSPRQLLSILAATLAFGVTAAAPAADEVTKSPAAGSPDAFRPADG